MEKVKLYKLLDLHELHSKKATHLAYNFLDPKIHLLLLVVVKFNLVLLVGREMIIYKVSSYPTTN
jgi:hypothetical protein